MRHVGCDGGPDREWELWEGSSLTDMKITKEDRKKNGNLIMFSADVSLDDGHPGDEKG